jgi:signal transduction histidine kinase
MTTLSSSRRGSGSAVPNLQRVVLLPGAVLALLGGGAVGWLLAADPTGTVRTTVLVVLLAIAVLTLLVAASTARTVQRRLARATAELDRAASDVASSVSYGDEQLRRAVEDLRQGRSPQQPVPLSAERRSAAGRFAPLLAQLEYAQLTAFGAVTEAAEVPEPNGAATQQVTVLVNLARRLQSLVHQGIKILDELEQQVEDPDLLRGLFEVDHIATRIRRYVENVAVLGGEVTRRQWRKPVPFASVVRSAIGEVERYSRVKPVPPIDGRLDGAAVADVVHLLAELVENATAFSPPGTQVYVRTQRVSTGLVVEIEDRGLGQEPEEERLRNTLLANPERVELGALLKDGRVGLYVVAVLARQHQIRVELRRNLFGGVTSLVLLPNPLLSEDDDDGESEDAHARASEPPPQDTGRPAQAYAAPVPAAAPYDPRAVSAGPEYGAPAAAPAPVRTPEPRMPEPRAPQPRTSRTGSTPYPSQERRDGRQEPAAVPSARREPQSPPPASYAPPAPQAYAPPVIQPYASLPPAPARSSGSSRPPLPQRSQQTHMAPQLQRPQHEGGYGTRPEDAAEYTPATPGLMAAYRRGVQAAEEQPGPSDG